MTDKTLVRVRIGIRAWIKNYIRHTEDMELLPNYCRLAYTVVRF